MDRYLAAAVQMHADLDKGRNLEIAKRLVTEAASRGAALVVLPEYFNALGHLAEMVRQAEPIPGPTSTAMSRLAAECSVTLVAGTICEAGATPERAYNTSLVFDPTGREVARYRKMHLFDVDLPGQVTFAESRWIAPGECSSAVRLALGCVGQAVCYDLRFPELFRRLADEGMDVLAFPSAFAAPTGAAHWEILLRARAIENQCYVVAADQFGQHTTNLVTYGHSMIIDPWGIPLASLDDGEGIVLAEIDLARLAEIRRQLPALAHRKRT
jgi:predicted amidohydrolase